MQVHDFLAPGRVEVSLLIIVSTDRDGAAAITFADCFFGFLASRLPRCSFDMGIS
jgi:hypothetical protein